MTTGEPAPAPASSSGKKRMSLIGYAFSPTPDINYNFVLGMYFVGSLLSALLYLCQSALQEDKAEDASSSSSVSLDEAAVDVDAAAAPAPTGSLLWGGGLFSLTRESKTELASSLEGMHLVFLPFIPCLLWSFIVRSNWLKQQQQKEQHTHETKKDL